jgi:hypothetical protein
MVIVMDPYGRILGKVKIIDSMVRCGIFVSWKIINGTKHFLFKICYNFDKILTQVYASSSFICMLFIRL